MKKHVVQFDVDGVLADFDLGYRELYHELYGVMKPRPTRWGQSGDHQVWQEIKSSSNFWSRLDPLASPAEFQAIQRMQGLSADVYFVTHRMGVDPKGQTEFWLRSQGISNPTVIVSGLKAEVARGIGATHCLDDKFGNAYTVSVYSRATKSYLLDAPYNQVDHEIVGGSVTRVKSVIEFLEEVL